VLLHLLLLWLRLVAPGQTVGVLHLPLLPLVLLLLLLLLLLLGLRVQAWVCRP
jgi:hypothetical protein